MQPLIYPSPEKTPSIVFPSTVGGGSCNLDNWLPASGPNGYPLYIRAFNIHFEVQLDTAAATVVEGPDWWRFIDGISIVQLDGVKRVNELRGDQLRVALEEKCGIHVLKEHADLAASQTNATRKLTFRVPMTSDLLYEGSDLELMADNFARIELRFPVLTADGFAVSGGTITLDSITVRVEAECVEHDYLLWAAVDELVAIPFPGTSVELQTDLNARLMGLSLHQRAANGGGSLANLSTVNLPGIFNEALKRDPDLLELFAAHRKITTGFAATDPGVNRVSSMFLEGRAAPVLWAHEEEKVWSGEVLARFTLKTVQTSAITNLVALVRKGLPRSAAVHKALAEKYNGGRPIKWELRTRDKTSRAQNLWADQNAAYLPKKAPIPGKPSMKR